jgi:exopolysaccharide biosynthesis WecB/TagA/CpsF family protein
MGKPFSDPGDDYAQESAMSRWPTTLLGGLPIVRCSMDEAAQGFVEQALLQRGTNARPFYSTSANGQVIALCAKNTDFQGLMFEADQIHADGMPMIMYSKMFSSQPVSERIATTDLVQAVAEKAERAGVSFYFLGGTEEVNAKAVAAMRSKYPNLIFAGRRNGYFAPGEEDAVIEDIQASKPDILWIGLGFPLEQAFVSRNIDRLRSVGVVKTSGGLFDFVSGKNARAPQWMQRYGLEWAYRMYNEPRRLTKRYLLSNPAAIRALFTHSN